MGGVFTQAGSKADLTAPKSNFSFTPESGLNSDIAPCPKGAKSGSQRQELKRSGGSFGNSGKAQTFRVFLHKVMPLVRPEILLKTRSTERRIGRLQAGS
jgi:hypothetical protein